jgi:hypothetical protein
MLLDTMKLLRSTGTNWVSVYSPAKFPTDSVPASAQSVLNHGVNLGQALKAEAVGWRFSQNQSDKAATAQYAPPFTVATNRSELVFSGTGTSFTSTTVCPLAVSH